MNMPSCGDSSDAPQYWAMDVMGHFAVLRFLQDFTHGGVELRRSLRLWESLETLIKGEHRILHVCYPHDGLSHHAFVGMWDSLCKAKAEEPHARTAMMRAEHALRRWITYLQDPRFFTVGVCSGEVDINFLGLLLACDYRIAAENAIIVNRGCPGVREGTAAPWFLAKTIGRGRAMQILVEDVEITAYIAKELGLVHRLVSGGSHEQASLEVTRSLAGRGTSHLLAAKRALAASASSLEEYFVSEGAGFDRWPGLPIGDPMCRQCGYNLTGNVSGRCPECGAGIDPEIRKLYGLVQDPDAGFAS